MNKLFKLENSNYNTELSDIQLKFLNECSSKFENTESFNIPISYKPFYDVILLNKIWDRYILEVLSYLSQIGMDPNEWELEEYEPNDLVGSVIDYVKMEPEVIKDLNESNRSFLGLLLDFRNKPLEILSILNTFKEYFIQKEPLCEFHKDLNRIFDLSGLMYNEDLTKDNYYLKLNFVIRKIFNQLGFKDIFTGFNMNEYNKPRQYIFQNLSVNYFLFMNLLIYMDEKMSFWDKIYINENVFDIKIWQDNFDEWIGNVVKISESLVYPPNISEERKQNIIKILDETDFGIVSSYGGLDFYVKDKNSDSYILGENKENRYKDTQQFINQLDFLNLFKRHAEDIYTYYEIYHSLQSIYEKEQTFTLCEFGNEVYYEYPINVNISYNSYCNELYPLFMLNNPFMRETLILSSKNQITEILYDWKQRLFIDSPLIASESNLHNLEFVCELLKHDFNQYTFLPDEIKKIEKIKKNALEEGINFMSNSGDVSDDYYSSEEYIKSLLGIGEDEL